MRIRANIHKGYVDKDIETFMYDLDAVYIRSHSPQLSWEAGIRYEQNNSEVIFDCPSDKVCEEESQTERSEFVYFVGISTFLAVPDF